VIFDIALCVVVATVVSAACTVNSHMSRACP